ncbi:MULTISPECIES: MDR family MFS transporter [Pseudonocardia]|uniref:MFS transporter n=1 Tax=Pseudonocardia saturnea TaxID=33909 RepID=A0ABQ0S6B6_9PSEU|nr:MULTISPECIES: MDR family MFS transporter [Pseudonocardia]TDN76553.1 DHA2 family lincomycin resistance protein-like MFS transporter [Pseudonocardia autotrophica]BBG00553.1 MFS transporter [Pseudonocardia autotrophica]GEC28455.1 MFS transporter [Pseudonocardia saturnea]
MTTEPSTEPAGAERLPAGAPLIISLLVGSAFVMILNETIMSVALPVLIADLGVTAATAQWLTSGFLLTMAVVIPITGYLLQRFPPRSVYLAAMSLFSAGTLLCAVAPAFGVLLAGRVVQATGTAVMIPLLMTTILRLVPASRRGQTMGTISIVIAVAPAIGPALSGVILSALGWRWMFWLVLPIALLALAAGALWLRVTAETSKAPLDVLSVLISAVAFSGLVYGLSAIGESAATGGDGEGVPPWVPLVVGVLALAVFVHRQIRLQRTAAPLLDLRPFAIRQYTVAVVLVAVGFMSLFGAIILLPLYIQDVLGDTAFVAGLVVLPGGLVMGLLAPFVGRAYDRLGARRLVIPGALLLSAVMWGFTTLGASSPIWLVVVLHIGLSAALALMFTPLMTDALGALPGELYSHGSAILTTLQQVAGAAGTALFITVMTLASAGAGVDAAGVQAAFLTAAFVSLLVLVFAMFVGRAPERATTA